MKPLFALLLLSLAVINSSAQENKEIYAQFDSLIATDPNNASYYFMTALGLFDEQQYEKSIPYFANTLKYLPQMQSKRNYLQDMAPLNKFDSATVVDLMGQSYRLCGKSDDAINLYRAIYLKTNDEKYIVRQGQILIETKRYKPLIALYQPFFKTSSDERISYGLAYAYYSEGNLKAADSIATIVLKLSPESIGFYKLKGQIALKENNPVRACDLFNTFFNHLDKASIQHSPDGNEFYKPLVEEVTTLRKQACEEHKK